MGIIIIFNMTVTVTVDKLQNFVDTKMGLVWLYIFIILGLL